MGRISGETSKSGLFTIFIVMYSLKFDNFLPINFSHKKNIIFLIKLNYEIYAKVDNFFKNSQLLFY
ncbi:MAG: hypothetical protein EAZ44_06080 [Cytophagia bacterium]|nr:MAG: hypothetical protein EAY69_11200 [Cytophagales bacterium]TAG03333.1 MAG: hypothetical protein EAZ44_06080 [Cytophagia bacterium]TAG42756.1 MAG: hypothetical protein EAZ31_05480 [Cytophagia bacterium]